MLTISGCLAPASRAVLAALPMANVDAKAPQEIAIAAAIAGLWFDITDGLIQAIVFSYLTMSYIGENVEAVNEYNEGAEERAMLKKEKKEKKAKKLAA